jgi:hypothetical protein
MIKKRVKKGRWSVLGIHGGVEGKQWQKGKRIVSRAKVQTRTVKSKAQTKILKLGKLKADDKRRLLREIEDAK